MLKDTINKIEDAVDSARYKYDRAEDASIDVYEGHGSQGKILIKGRVLEDFPVVSDPDQGVLRNARDMLARYETDEVPRAKVRIHLSEHETLQETADDEGYFFAHIPWEPPAHPDRHDQGRWHHVHLELLDPVSSEGAGTRYAAPFQYPTTRTRLCVVSDIDDTIIQTGADNFLEHVTTVMLNNPYTREVFAGMPELLQALVDEQGEDANLLFFLSSSPWNLHRFFQDTFLHNDVPRGSFFLKDFGIDRKKFIKSGHGEHKEKHIRRLIAAYPDLDFVLIGDSGQEDSEIYATVLADHPDRIAACYIRNISDAQRTDAVQEMAERLYKEFGVPFELCQDSAHMARHARDLGLIEPSGCERVEAAID